MSAERHSQVRMQADVIVSGNVSNFCHCRLSLSYKTKATVVFRFHFCPSWCPKSPLFTLGELRMESTIVWLAKCANEEALTSSIANTNMIFSARLDGETGMCTRQQGGVNSVQLFSERLSLHQWALDIVLWGAITKVIFEKGVWCVVIFYTFRTYIYYASKLNHITDKTRVKDTFILGAPSYSSEILTHLFNNQIVTLNEVIMKDIEEFKAINKVGYYFFWSCHDVLIPLELYFEGVDLCFHRRQSFRSPHHNDAREIQGFIVIFCSVSILLKLILIYSV